MLGADEAEDLPRHRLHHILDIGSYLARDIFQYLQHRSWFNPYCRGLDHLHYRFYLIEHLGELDGGVLRGSLVFPTCFHCSHQILAGIFKHLRLYLKCFPQLFSVY